VLDCADFSGAGPDLRNKVQGGVRAKKMPGTRPGEVQQGGENDERYRIIAFESSNRGRFLTIQEKMGSICTLPLCIHCITRGAVRKVGHVSR
jgi:hypothetical protein